jgi:2-keto-3-deoxy-galactonokinase
MRLGSPVISLVYSYSGHRQGGCEALHVCTAACYSDILVGVRQKRSKKIVTFVPLIHKEYIVEYMIAKNT